jgi:hypothetical protein
MPNKVFIPDTALFDDQLGVVQNKSAHDSKSQIKVGLKE